MSKKKIKRQQSKKAKPLTPVQLRALTIRVEREDREKWELKNTLRAHDTYRLFRESENQNLQRRREEQTEGERIQGLILRLGSIQRANVKPLGNSSPSSESSDPFVDEGIGDLEGYEVQRFLEDLRHEDDDVRVAAIEQLENAADRHQGFLRLERNQSTNELNERLLAEFEGFTPAEIAKLEPRLGKAKAIRLIRQEAGRNRDTGILLEDDTAKH